MISEIWNKGGGVMYWMRLIKIYSLITFGTFFLLVLISYPVNAAGPWYVSVSGDDSNDCLSISTPCATINSALAKASADDTIFVAIGTYVGTGLEVVLLDKDATVSGGWNDTFTSQSSNSTIDGQGARRGIMVNSDVSATIEHFVIENCVGPTAQGAGGIFNYGGNLTLKNCTVVGNSSYGGTQGGGILNRSGTLYLNNCIVSNNTANMGAGVYADGLGTVILNNSTISNNSSSGQGGGLYSLASNLTLNNSAITDNTARVRGGGIYHNPPGTVILTNTTVSGNSTIPPWEGGGIYHTGNDSILYLNSSTVTNNQAGDGGGIYSGGGVGSSVTVQNTILAGNVPTDCRASSFTPTSSAGYNLIGNTSGCNFIPSVGDLTNIDPLLDLLADNGGPTKTHALLVDSPAIDAGADNCTDADGNPLLIDQRGEPRPVDGNDDGIAVCDMGAYEVQPPVIFVEVDVKPYSPNQNINPNSSSLVAVAVLTSDEFDALRINPDTVQFGPDGAAKVHSQTHVKDVDNDGNADLLFHFRMPETGIHCGDTVATLTGQTWGEELVSGTDNIRTVGCK
jgi:hypothetical protein